MGASEEDGLAIARERIAQEREERTGYLDLGMLGLTALPEELFELQHLQALNLGRPFGEGDIAWQKSRIGYTQSEIIVTSLPGGNIGPSRPAA